MWHGDSIDLMEQMPDRSVDMVLCDLPYGTTACKWDVVIPFEKLWEQYKRVVKKNGAIVLFGAQPFTSLLITSNLRMFKYEWVWCKNMATGFASAKYKPMRTHEDILVFCDGKTTYNPILEPTISQITKDFVKRGTKHKSRPQTSPHSFGLKNEYKETEYRCMVYPKSTQRFDCVPRKSGTLHPTQKPVDLLEYLIKTYTNETETVLDNCMGSGSTGVACMRINRVFWGIEKEREYYEIANKRVFDAAFVNYAKVGAGETAIQEDWTK